MEIKKKISQKLADIGSEAKRRVENRRRDFLRKPLETGKPISGDIGKDEETDSRKILDRLKNSIPICPPHKYLSKVGENALSDTTYCSPNAENTLNKHKTIYKEIIDYYNRERDKSVDPQVLTEEVKKRLNSIEENLNKEIRHYKELLRTAEGLDHPMYKKKSLIAKTLEYPEEEVMVSSKDVNKFKADVRFLQSILKLKDVVKERILLGEDLKKMEAGNEELNTLEKQLPTQPTSQESHERTLTQSQVMHILQTFHWRKSDSLSEEIGSVREIFTKEIAYRKDRIKYIDEKLLNVDSNDTSNPAGVEQQREVTLEENPQTGGLDELYR